MMQAVLRSLAVAAAATLCCNAQAPPQSTRQPSPVPAPSQDQSAASPHFIQLRYPRDKETTIALVDGLPIWLEHLVQHIDERHYPGFHRLMAGADDTGSPDGTRLLESDLIAPWVRQMADIRAFEAEAKARGDLDQKRLDECHAAALKVAFQSYLDTYVEDLRQNGRPTELSQKRVNRLLTDYQMRHGLACELQGWIDYLAPVREWTNQELNDFFQDHARYFGGGATIAQILIQNRDAGTGILLAEEGRIRAASRLAEVQKRLLPDGSNFEDLARQFSDDTRLGSEGGVMRAVERFDHRMPTALCRAAWTMKDGQVSDVIETQYGWHLVKRIEHEQRMLMLFSEATLPYVRQLIHREEQENLLFAVRARHEIELKL